MKNETEFGDSPAEERAQVRRENEQLRHENAEMRREVDSLEQAIRGMESELRRSEQRVGSLEALLGETLLDSEERIQRMKTLAEAHENVADGIEQFVKHSWHFHAEQRAVVDEIQQLAQHSQHIRAVIASSSAIKLAKREERPEISRPTE